MKLLLLSIPLLVTLFGFGIYKFQDGKGREIFRLDLVQFMYLFVLTPTLYVWMKSFLFYLLRSELAFQLNMTGLFVIDTIFSVLAFFTFAALAMHSLTKTFWLKRTHDPEFDVYHLSEYFHLHWTHIVIWSGGMTLMAFIALVNIFIPFQGMHIVYQFYGLLGGGIFFGLLTFIGIWGSDPGQGNFMQIMKLLLIIIFVFHVILYFVFDPPFRQAHGAYWFSLFLFLSASVASFFFDKSAHAKKVRGLWLHVGWGDNIQLFPLPKKRKNKK